MDKNEMPETYIGDGVYVQFDGYSIIARTHRIQGVHWIAFEPDMIENMIKFREKCLKEMYPENTPAK